MNAWDDLSMLFGERDETKEFLHFWNHADLAARSRILRDHKKDPDGVTDPFEQRCRSGADFLLGYYAVLELAMLTGYAPGEPPSALRDDALAFLQDSTARSYFEESYPVLLPVLFRERLLGKWNRTATSESSRATFWRFLGFVARTREDVMLNKFLSFLDGFVIQGGRNMYAAIAKEFSDPVRLLSNLLKESGDRSAQEEIVLGLRSFFEFAKEFDEILRRTQDTVLRAELWLFYDYYFRALGSQLGKQLDQAAAAIRRGAATQERTLEAVRSSEIFDQYWAAVERLRDENTYGRPVLATRANP